MKTAQHYRKRTFAVAVTVCLGLSSALCSTHLYAERITIPLGQQGEAWNVQAPRTGLSKSQVEESYGPPISRKGPVGDPPIYTWEYEKFRVYFEGEHVIHSVVKHQPSQTQP